MVVTNQFIWRMSLIISIIRVFFDVQKKEKSIFFLIEIFEIFIYRVF